MPDVVERSFVGRHALEQPGSLADNLVSLKAGDANKGIVHIRDGRASVEGRGWLGYKDGLGDPGNRGDPRRALGEPHLAVGSSAQLQRQRGRGGRFAETGTRRTSGLRLFHRTLQCGVPTVGPIALQRLFAIHLAEEQRLVGHQQADESRDENAPPEHHSR